ncbi:MAG TPA: HAMP domain-containing sensor histidine kinase [Vicinamibacterales bacterium]|jgi:signal transduction histidine kinase|nr:HAMP domain-containing sensor histidine kinase [Vicinamibacterales bacterium]
MTGRQKAIGFFITLCVLLVGAAILGWIYWIVITEKLTIVQLVVGILLFALIIAGLIVYTVFLVVEIKRNEEHDTFINSVTHELKTPLASIRLYLDTLKTRPVGDAQRQEFYDVMLADVERLRHTVDQVLKAGVAREKRRPVFRTPLEMGELARECVDLAVMRHHLQPGAIALEAHDGASLTVSGDAEELRTVITNLLDNAVKYSGSDVRVTVSLAAPSPDTIWVRVQDRGVGIPRKQLKRIFKRFYRVQARGIRQVKGTGLGLYIVRTIARAHGGRVFAQSEGEGRGATFTVELPRATS